MRLPHEQVRIGRRLLLRVRVRVRARARARARVRIRVRVRRVGRAPPRHPTLWAEPGPAAGRLAATRAREPQRAS